MQTRKLTKYHIHTGRLTRPVDFAVVSDLHDESYDDLWPMLDGADALLVPGDVCDRYRQSSARGVAFLKEAAGRLQTAASQALVLLGQPGREAEVRARLREILQTAEGLQEPAPGTGM